MDIIKPGMFGKSFSADTRRRVFDFHNEQILSEQKNVDFVFIGDSITEYWDLNAYFENSGFIVNRGIGGDISEIVLKRFEADVLQLKPGNVICLIGCNDLMTMHYDPWWKVAGRDEKEIISGLIKNIEEIIKKCSGVKLYICSVLPSHLCAPYNAEKFNEAILETNEKIKDLCSKSDAEFIDYHGVLCKEDGKTVMDNLTYDGVHPNPNGYKIMAELLKENVEGLN